MALQRPHGTVAAYLLRLKNVKEAERTRGVVAWAEPHVLLPLLHLLPKFLDVQVVRYAVAGFAYELGCLRL